MDELEDEDEDDAQEVSGLTHHPYIPIFCVSVMRNLP